MGCDEEFAEREWRIANPAHGVPGRLDWPAERTESMTAAFVGIAGRPVPARLENKGAAVPEGRSLIWPESL
jgi:hypothetical protein